MNAIAAGFITFGILVGLLLCVILFRFANTNKKMKTEYDERQRAIRNIGYRNAFYGMLITEVILMILGISKLELPVTGYALHFAPIFVGCTVLGVYTVWKDAYWGMNNDRRRYAVIFAVLILLNVFPVVMACINNSLMEDGKLGMPVMNIMVIIMMAVLLAALALRKVVGPDSDDTEED